MEKKTYIHTMKRLLNIAIFTLALCTGLFLPMQANTKDITAKQQVRQSAGFTQTKVRLIKGQKLRLSLRGINGKAKWTSKDKKIASVDQTGTVLAKKNGKTKIRVTYQGTTYQCTVWVETPKLSKKTITIKTGKTAQLKMNGTKQSVSWSCSPKDIATVNKKGVITAKHPGTAIVTAKIGTKSYRCKVTVTESGKTGSQTEIRIKEGTHIPLGQSSITVILKNNSSQTIHIADGYTLYQKQKGRWEVSPVNFVSTCGTKKLAPGKTMKRICRLENEETGDKCQIGEYRIQIGTLQTEFQIVDAKESTNAPGTSEVLEAPIAPGTPDTPEVPVAPGTAEDPTPSPDVWELKSVDGTKIPAGQPYLTLQLTNCSSHTASLPRYYNVYTKQNGEWVSIPLDYCFTDDMVDVEPDGIMEFSCPLSNMDGNYPPGEYRIEKYISPGCQPSIEFEILP